MATTKKTPAKKSSAKKAPVRKSALSEQDKNTIWILFTIAIVLVALVAFYLHG